ncbi:hypothetical protein [Alkalicoccus luteus]
MLSFLEDLAGAVYDLIRMLIMMVTTMFGGAMLVFIPVVLFVYSLSFF